LSLLLYFLVGSELSLNPSYIGYNPVCAAEGFKFDVWINPFGGYSTCYGNPENLLVSIIGPVFGAMAAGAPLAISKIKTQQDVADSAARSPCQRGNQDSDRGCGMNASFHNP